MSISAPGPSELSCPRCDASHVVRWGWVQTVRTPPRRRFRCMACRRTFSEHTGKAVAGSWYPHRWPELCRELVEQTSVRETARRLGVAPSTAFRWRHRALQALADHRERMGRNQLGRPGTHMPSEAGLGDVDDGNPDESATASEAEPDLDGGADGAAKWRVGVMPLRFKVSPGWGPDPEPLRFFRLLVAADGAGRVALDHDVPGAIAGPPGSRLPLWDWVFSDKAVFRFPLKPVDRVPSPRRFLARWCAPGCEIRWVGWRFYEWSKVAAEFGMTAVKWPPVGISTEGSGDGDGDGSGEVAARARKLAARLRSWIRRYCGVSTRWLRGYLALFAELSEAEFEEARREAGLNRALRDPSAWRRFRERRWARLAWRIARISLRAREGSEATLRRSWIR